MMGTEKFGGRLVGTTFVSVLLSLLLALTRERGRSFCRCGGHCICIDKSGDRPCNANIDRHNIAQGDSLL